MKTTVLYWSQAVGKQTPLLNPLPGTQKMSDLQTASDYLLNDSTNDERLALVEPYLYDLQIGQTVIATIELFGQLFDLPVTRTA
jgi:hypothetical protein